MYEIVGLSSYLHCDQNMAQVYIGLPAQSRVIDSITYGTAAWTRAVRITVVLEDSSEKLYFLKVSR